VISAIFIICASTSFLSDYDVFPISDPNPNGKARIHLATLLNITWNNTDITGSIWTLDNPAYHFSIYTTEKGCGVEQATSVTARNRNCVLATNGGLFNRSTGACIGNLISDSTILHKGQDMNVNFGIKNDSNNGKSLIMGYVNQTDFLKVPFDNLVSGMGWLVRAGNSFLSKSIVYENIEPRIVHKKLART